MWNSVTNKVTSMRTADFTQIEVMVNQLQIARKRSNYMPKFLQVTNY